MTLSTFKMLLSFLSYCAIVACNNTHGKDAFKKNEANSIPNKNTIGFDSVSHMTINQHADTVNKVAILYYKQYKIEIEETVLTDSIPPNYANMFNPIPLSNYLKFYKSNILITRQTIPYKKIYAKTYQSKPVNLLDNKIAEVRFVKSQELNLIMVSGYGGCNSCNESTIYFTFEGSIAYFWYGGQNNTIKEINYKKNLTSDILNDTTITKVFANIW